MKIGIFQSACANLSVTQRIEALSAMIDEFQNEKDSLDLVVCPELFMSGYNVGNQLIESAQKPDGEIYQKVRTLALSHDCACVYGYAEIAGELLFNSAAFVSADGTLLANHRKRLNSPGSFEEDYFTPGDCTTRFDYNGFRIAMMICYEVEFPESVRMAAADGAELILVPTALVSQWGVVADKLVPTRAFENGVWLAYANHAGHENGFDYFGGSKIVAPNGDIRADAGDSQTLIAVDIDINSVKAAQMRLPYLEHYTKL